MKDLVSIITPCYNGERFIDRYFESILSQTYENLELIFVNDGSTDRTEQIALSYREKLKERGIKFIYLSQENGGQAKAMNTGFQYMSGKYFVWPDSDDLLTADSIEKRVKFLEEHPQYTFVRSSGYTFDFETGERIGSVNFGYYHDPAEEDIFLDLITEYTYCMCGCYMVRTDAFLEIYPDRKIYETNVGQNWQIMIPVAGRGKCGYIDEEQYAVAIRTDSHSHHKRPLEEAVSRQLELKKVLEIGIRLSNRTDADYQRIVDVKYMHVLFKMYYEADRYEESKKYYELLKSEHELSTDEEALFLKKWHPAKYKAFYAGLMLKNLPDKLKKLTGKKREG